MAALQTIRNRGILLVSVIAFALFLFVIGDFLRGGEVLFQQSKQNVGEINGEKVSIQEYQDLTKEYQNFYEVMSQKSSFSEQELNQINDEAWNNYIQNTLIKKECDALGLAVTDEEVSEILKSGQSQFLQTPIFMNQQGRYDYANVQAFLNAYKEAKENGQLNSDIEKVYSYYMFAQRQSATSSSHRSTRHSSLLHSFQTQSRLRFHSRAAATRLTSSLQQFQCHQLPTRT